MVAIDVAKSAPSAAFLHLSDLHLGEDVKDVGLVSRGKFAFLKGIMEEGGLKMQAHDPFIFTALPEAVRSAARFVKVPADSFDLHLVTGDISTAASSDERFAFASQFLRDEVRIDKQYSTGFKWPERKIFCIPGNHDKMYESNPKRYLTSFGKLPAPPPYKREVKIKRSGQRFIFYAIDSNLYNGPNIAIGKIYPATMGWLAEEFGKVSQDAGKAGIVRILVLHHHAADLNPYRKRSFGSFIASFYRGDLTKLREGDRLLELCAGNIDLILHGHEHLPVVFYNDKSNCVIQSAGTASQFNSKKKLRNSFHTLAFYGRKVLMTQFDWDEARFLPTRYWKADLDTRELDGPSSY